MVHGSRAGAITIPTPMDAMRLPNIGMCHGHVCREF
jgi:hypothetical protein